MNLKKRILNNYSKLNETDLHIWDYINNNRLNVSKMTITELADKTNVSRTTITRFVNKLEMEGYSELKVRLSMEPAQETTFNIEDYNAACDILIDYIEELKNIEFKNECKLLYNANRIFIYGTGDIQQSVGDQLSRMLLSQEKLAYTMSNKTIDNSIFNIMSSEDLLLIISLSGDNDQAVQVAKKAKLNGTKIISITDFKNNQLNALSDERIYIYSPEVNFVNPFDTYRITTMYYVLVEMLVIRYSVYKNQILNE